MSAPLHQPFYCEENIWHLAADPVVGEAPRVVAIITNEARKVAVWQQRAGQDDEGLVVWDYHVILIAGRGEGARVWDLDSRLGAPVPFADYLVETFRDSPKLFAPRFRLIEADEYRAKMSSDRRHMRDDRGEFMKPAPSWPCIGSGHSLPALLDLNAPEPGRVMGLRELVDDLEVTRTSRDVQPPHPMK